MATTPSDCCYASGGRVTVAINGVLVSPRTVAVIPVNFEREVKSNADGTIYTVNKPMPAEADITLSDACGLDVYALMGCPIDVTIDFLDMHRRYLFTKAVMVGRPKINAEAGEISGLKVTGNTVQTVNY
jgi:hypothetical protein